jgi:NitT/TauT family transport system substrate-binding protein
MALAGPASAETLSKEPIKVGVGVDPAFSAIYYAQQNKLFQQAGLNVELVQFTQGGDALDSLVAGQVQLAASAESTIMIRATRADVRGIAVFSESGSFIKFVLRKGVKDVKQAKKLGIVPGSVSEFSTVKLLQKYGIDEKSVELVKAGPPELPALLARGSIDGYFIWEPWPTNGVKQGGHIFTTSGDVGYVYNMLIAGTGPWLEQHRSEAEAFLKALAKSCAALRADPAKAGAASHIAIKLPAAQANTLLKGVHWGVRNFSAADIARYKEISAFQVARKITPTLVNVDKFADNSFYKP